MLVDWLVAKGVVETRTVNGEVQYRAVRSTLHRRSCDLGAPPTTAVR